MNKKETLAFIQEKLNENTITKQDVEQLITVSHTQKDSDTSHTLTNVLYVIGGLIAVIGVLILVVQNWEAIGFVGRLLITLGIAISTYVSGFLIKGRLERVLSEVFFVISAILAPIGIWVYIDEFNFIFNSKIQALYALALSILFITAYQQTKRILTILIAVGFLTWTYFALLSYVLVFDSNMFKWATCAIGIAYMSFAYYIQTQLSYPTKSETTEKEVVQTIIYGAGTIATLTSLITVGGFFDVIFVLILFGFLYLSVFLKNKIILIIGALFLIIHIIKFTSKYFIDSLGWPVALIFIGFLVIGIGYTTVYISKKYMTDTLIDTN